MSELENLIQLYDKNGGNNKIFKKNIEKMEHFYKNILEEGKLKKSNFGDESRGSTPIKKLN